MEELEALIAEHLEPARRKLARDKILFDQLRTSEIEVTSPDRTVKIAQTCAGEILSVEIVAGAFDRYDEQSFSKLLTSAIKAARNVGRQAAEQFTDEILQKRYESRGR